jgi:hypothetical protein
MGDCHPDAHENGLSGCNFIALICISFLASNVSNIFIVVKKVEKTCEISKNPAVERNVPSRKKQKTC